MDKDQQRSRQCEDTVRVHGIDPTTVEQSEHTSAFEQAHSSNKIHTEQLLRDREASKRLREEAYARRRLSRLRQESVEAQFEKAQCVANSNHTSVKAQAPQTAEAVSPESPVQTDEMVQAQDLATVEEELHKVFTKKTPPSQEKAHKRKKKRSRRKKTSQAVTHDSRLKKLGKRGLKILLYVLLLGILIGVAFATLWAVRAERAPTPIENIPQAQQAAVAQEREKSNVYILLAGTDQRADEASRSDTIIYAAVRPADRKVEMVSIPRDTLVNIPDAGEGKVNAALAYGGMDLLSQTVSELVDNPVDHTVLVNFQSFAKIIDAMGGIKINVPEKMYLPEEGIDLEAGEQKLNGEDALAFVRWRGDGLGDIGRMERQSQFMQAVMDKMRHLPPWRWATTIWAVTHEIDTDLSTFDLLSLAWKFIGMDSGALEYQSFALNPTYIDGVSYVLLDDYNIDMVLQEMKYGMVLDDGYGDAGEEIYY